MEHTGAKYKWYARGADVLNLPDGGYGPTYRALGRYTCVNNHTAETLAHNLNTMDERYAELEAKVKTFEERALLAESYYILGQMPDRWSCWAPERDLWMKAFEATLPPEPKVKMVTVELPEQRCIRTSAHAAHVASGGKAFCPGITDETLIPYWDNDDW